jgi:hypothetical protein
VESLPILIRLVLDADNPDRGRSILEAMRGELSFTIESIAPYHKGGMLAVLRAKVLGHDWPHQAHASLLFAQTMAFHWLLLGGGDTELELVADGNFRFPGIMWGEVQVGRYRPNTEMPEREGSPI